MPLRTKDREVPPGSGNPRLVQSNGGHALAGSPEAEGIEQSYPLGIDVTTIGSADGQDIVLADIEAAHGEVRREADGDEYVFHHLSATGVSHVDGAIVASAPLHHGDRLTLGRWTLVYQRDEHAEHGRFDGGREGGESSGSTILAGGGGHESEPNEVPPTD